MWILLISPLVEVALDLTARFKYTCVHILFLVLSSLREVMSGKGRLWLELMDDNEYGK